MNEQNSEPVPTVTQHPRLSPNAATADPSGRRTQTGASKLTGKLIVFDGIDGCGKTRQCDRLAGRLRSAGVQVCQVREPGGTSIGEEIRKLLLTSRGEGLHMRTEMLLYMASRAQLVQEQIKPALARGCCVLADRYVSSTIAYQGAGGGLPLEDIVAVAGAATENLQADLTLILDLPVAVAMGRLHGPGGKGKRRGSPQTGLFQDRIEQRVQTYHEKVRQGFLEYARRCADHCRVIKAQGSPETVEEVISATLADFFR